MPELQPWQASQSFPVHKSWEAVWATDLKDAELRKGIWSDQRFSKRIIASLAPVPDAPPPAPLNVRTIEVLIQSATRRDMLRQIGLGWLAPVLASKLLNSSSRQMYGSLSNAEMKLVLETRDHASPDLIGDLHPGTALERQGALCLHAWLSNVPDGYHATLTLLLPVLEEAAPAEEPNRLAARVNLINRMFAEPAR